jgi:hypothetical protein
LSGAVKIRIGGGSWSRVTQLPQGAFRHSSRATGKETASKRQAGQRSTQRACRGRMVCKVKAVCKDKGSL